MKTIINLLSILSLCCIEKATAYISNPYPIDSTIIIQRVKDVNQFITRMARRPTDGQLFYTTFSGKIYRMGTGTTAPSDVLIYNTATTSPVIDELQGILFFGDTIYISGIRKQGTNYYHGIIAKGIPNGSSWVFTEIMKTDSIQAITDFDHRLSGLNITLDGDSLVFCIGARGDHGEIQTNGGVFPGLRNTPLTTNIYKIPARNSSLIRLPNDSALLASSGYVYTRGIRNTYDLDFTADGNLFGVENSGDYDHNEEMNWLRPGLHYGFPWVMGTNDNPQQFANFAPGSDLRIPHCSKSWRYGTWQNDPTFPSRPTGLPFAAPILNFGPDADKYRDSAGSIHDASDEGISLSTFTGHRSPLGLVFDNDSVLCPAYRGDGFTLSWTPRADSSGCRTTTDMGVFVDSSEDVLHLHLTYDASTDNYRMNATRIVGGFLNPVDAVLDSNRLYVIEFGVSPIVPGLYAVTLPTVCSTCAPPANDSCLQAQDLGLDMGAVSCVQDTVTLTGTLDCSGIENTGACSSTSYDGDVWYRFSSQGRPFSFTLASSQSVGVSLFSGSTCNALSIDTCVTALSAGDTVRILDPSPGFLYLRISDDSSAFATAFELAFLFEPLTLEITDTSTTSCSNCFDGSIIFRTEGFSNSYSVTLTPDTGVLSGNTIYDLPAGFYVLCITDSAGCTACDSANVDFNTDTYPLEPQNPIRISPNPNTGRFTLFHENGKDDLLLIRDSSGRIVCSERINSEVTTLDLSNLQQGTYYLQIGNNKSAAPVVIRR